jgi:hypothetical protein
MASTTTAERFATKVDHDGPTPQHRPDLGPCWVWTSSLNQSGYGQLYVGGGRHMYLAHKWAWEQEHGPVPDGLELDHLCRHRDCVRPSHLEAVTHAENLRRGTSPSALVAGRDACGRGHPYTPESTYIGARGARYCRVCKRERDRAYYQRKATAMKEPNTQLDAVAAA